ncbi:TonB-dependent receptor [Phenylobacterium sp.]|uniref:TonB-dependent receptor domain-containing protein n=1 Tax=Phenylobacterium sp. TaxID=1871053 RepID=UPI0025D5235B|nr:TonB-dependent receptor [Phenylobacterium sp.]
MLQYRVLLAATAALGVAAPALAQPPAGKDPPTVGEVRVEGAPPPVRTSIDRNSYSVANDLQATAGSISDALRNVPSLEVDVNGNVALRGDPNVTVLIDGKPSGQFQGENRAQALQNLPADQIDRVEVITNPSAAFDPNGSAGIINLITKKARKPGMNGTARANLGSNGRQNGGVSASYRAGKVTLSGDANLRHDSIKQDYSRARRITEPSGTVRESLQDGTQGGRINVASLRGGLDYDVSKDTRLSLELRYNRFDFRDRSYESFGEAAGGLLTEGYDRFGRTDQDNEQRAATVRLHHSFGDDHTLDLDVGQERIAFGQARTAMSILRTAAGPVPYERILGDAGFRKTTARLEYARPLPGPAKLKLGYSLEADDNDYRNTGLRGRSAAAAAPDPALINTFLFDRQVHALYVTYERPFGKLSVLAGLRLEVTPIDLDQVTQAIRAKNDDTSLYPSLHLSYALGDDQKLKASYSKRIQRPNPFDYNPFRVYQDPQNFRAGNPALEPQKTDSFELGYERRKGGAILQATAYYRDVRDSVTDVVRDLGGGVFLTTRDNLGKSRTAGLELVANGRVTPTLTYNLSSNAYWTEIDGRGVGLGGRVRDGWTVSGRGNLSWQAASADFLQLNVFVNGERLSPQGYFKPFGGVNLGYRHKFNDRLSAVATVQDVFDTIRFKGVIDTPALHDVQRFIPQNRVVFVGFTYAFGGGKPRDQGFDFGGGGGPPT